MIESPSTDAKAGGVPELASMQRGRMIDTMSDRILHRVSVEHEQEHRSQAWKRRARTLPDRFRVGGPGSLG